ncbi:MAG TPA: hypothetical protein VFN67_16975 [Polyangiales bacterium]|nr:hypothetical protein [Polyangiales bacterium]
MLERTQWIAAVTVLLGNSACADDGSTKQRVQAGRSEDPAGRADDHESGRVTQGSVSAARPSESSAAKPDAAATATDAGAAMSEHGESQQNASGTQSHPDAGQSPPELDAAIEQDAGVVGSPKSEPRPTITLSGVLLQAGLPFTTQSNVKLCVLDEPENCAQSGPNGAIDLQLPANSRTGTILPRSDTYYPSMSPLITADRNISMSGRLPWGNPASAVAIPLPLFTSLFEQLGLTADGEKGHADFVASALNGGTVTVEGANAGPEWWGNGQTATHFEDGPPSGGAQLLGFVNIDPGMVVFRAEKNGKPCQWDPLVWPGDEPGTVRVPIRPDTWTRLLEVRCE